MRYYNFDILGGSSADGLAKAPAVAGLRPKAAVIELCINDAATSKNVSLAQSLQNMQDIAAIILATSPDTKLALMTMNPAIGGAVSGRPNVPGYHAQYRSLVRRNSGWMLIDNEPAWSGATAVEIPDGLHPLLMQVHQRLVPDILSVIGPIVH